MPPAGDLFQQFQRATQSPALTSAFLFLASSTVHDACLSSIFAASTPQTYNAALITPALGLGATALVSFAGPQLSSRSPAFQNCFACLDQIGPRSSHGDQRDPRKLSLAIAVLLALGQSLWALSSAFVPFHLLESLPIMSGCAILFGLTFSTSLAKPSAPVRLYILSVTALFGFTMSTSRVAVFGANVASLSILAQAGLHCALKHSLSNATPTPSALLRKTTPVAAGLSIVITFLYGLDLAKLYQLPPTSKMTLFLYTVSSVLSNFSLVQLISHVDAITSVSLLMLPRALLVLLFSSAVWSGLVDATWMMFYVLFSVSSFAWLFYSNSLASGSLPQLVAEDDEVDAEKGSSDSDSTSEQTPRSSKLNATWRWAAVVALLPYLFWLVYTEPLSRFRPRLSLSLRDASANANKTPTLDVVFAYYDEPVDHITEQMEYLRSVPSVGDRDPVFIAYVKGADVNLADFKTSTGVDEVYRLANKGREGDTYLHHILRNYNMSVDPEIPHPQRDEFGGFIEPRGFADHTIFLQSHMSWEWISKPRVPLLRPNTGYLAFGPYLTMNCGQDGAGNGDYWRQRDMYMIFEERFCPPDEPQLANYAAQFVVSRKRLLARSYSKFKYVKDMMNAPMDHWIHQDATWWHYNGEQSDSNPYLGHALERSWAQIMGCLDGSIADKCKDDVFDVDKCQCFDF